MKESYATLRSPVTNPAPTWLVLDAGRISREELARSLCPRTVRWRNSGGFEMWRGSLCWHTSSTSATPCRRWTNRLSFKRDDSTLVQFRCNVHDFPLVLGDELGSRRVDPSVAITPEGTTEIPFSLKASTYVSLSSRARIMAALFRCSSATHLAQAAKVFQYSFSLAGFQLLAAFTQCSLTLGLDGGVIAAAIRSNLSACPRRVLSPHGSSQLSGLSIRYAYRFDPSMYSSQSRPL